MAETKLNTVSDLHRWLPVFTFNSTVSPAVFVCFPSSLLFLGLACFFKISFDYVDVMLSYVSTYIHTSLIPKQSFVGVFVLFVVVFIHFLADVILFPVLTAHLYFLFSDQFVHVF